MIDADTVDRGSALMSELWEHVVMRFDEMLSEAELTGTLPPRKSSFNACVKAWTRTALRVPHSSMCMRFLKH